MADIDKLKNEARKTIRSLLLSIKEGLALRMLEKDHMDLMGSAIPFKKLGYASTADLLDDMPDVCRKAYDKTGMQVYKAVADESTAHIADLVAHQRSNKKKSRRGGKFNSYSRQPKSNYSFLSSQKYVPSFTSNPGRPMSSQRSGYTAGRHARNNHMHYAGHQHRTQDHSRINRSSQLRPSGGSMSDSSSSRTPASLIVTIPNRPPPNPYRQQSEADVRNNISKLLKAYEGGLWLSSLPDKYLGYFGLHLPERYRNSIVEWTDLINVETLHNRVMLTAATEDSKQQAASGSHQQQTSSSNGFEAAEGDAKDFVGEIKSPSSFNVGEKCEVYVSYVSSETDDVYVQRADSCINDLMAKLDEHFESIKLKSYKNVPGGCLCATKDSVYDAWNRSVVLETNSNSKAKILFLDYGNTETKSMQDMQPLPAEFTRQPAQAIPVRLFNITTKDRNLLAKELTSITDRVPLTLRCSSIVGNICSVLIYQTGNTPVCINQKLVDLGLASWKDERLAISQADSRAPSPPQPGTPTSQTEENTSQSTPPDCECWTVIVGHIISPSLIYLQIKDQSTEEFMKFQEQAPAVYRDKTPVSLLDIDKLYITCDDGDWHRVCAKGFLPKEPKDSGRRIECEYVDYGSIGAVDIKHIYNITDEHKRIPHQARLCSLYGLDQLSDTDEVDPVLTDKLDELIGDKTLIAQVITVDGSIPRVVLFDTSGDDDIEINKEIGKLVADGSLSGAFPEPQKSMDVMLTYIERDGRIYIQKVGPAIECLRELMANINNYYLPQEDDLHHSPPALVKESLVTCPKLGDVVCAQFDQLWYRAEVQLLPSESQVLVFYGDYGNTALISIKDLRKLPQHIEHCTTLPMQALACRLSDVKLDWNSELVAAASRRLIDSPTPYTLTTVKSATSGELTLVQLSQNGLVVNDHLVKLCSKKRPDTHDTEGLNPVSFTGTTPAPQNIAQSSGDHTASPSTVFPGTPPGTPPDESRFTAEGDGIMKPAAKLNCIMDNGDQAATKEDSMLHTLHQLSLRDHTCRTDFVSPPDVDEYWDVFVTTTNEPDHFVIISLSETGKLNELLDNLHKEYEVKIVFPDYGNFDFVATTDLRPLRKEHTLLKFQAVRAGLYDLEPAIGNCWSDDAKREFIEMCHEKKLVAVIKSVDRSKSLLSAGPSVWFELHDTTTETEINIDAELVKRGHAKYKVCVAMTTSQAAV